MVKELNPKNRFLMGPGPSDVHPRVLKALATPLIGHLDPQFIQIMDEVMEMTRLLFQTKNQVTSVISATGSAGMETCFVNLLEPGDTAIVCVNGVFGNRMCDIVERCGATLIRVDAPWGEPIDPQQVKMALEHSDPRLVSIVHAETSTAKGIDKTLLLKENQLPLIDAIEQYILEFLALIQNYKKD
jgi:alanine-glyoxylate transaminase/serine-glyoxylate transaminase/serine-pyruvate transaminase